MFAEDISEEFSDITLLDFIVFLDIFESFAEDCFLLRSFRKFLPSGFLLVSRFQVQLQAVKVPTFFRWAPPNQEGDGLKLKALPKGPTESGSEWL